MYKIEVYQTDSKPEWIQPTRESDICVRFGHIEGMDADKIAYATQASEAVYIAEEVKAYIMRERYSHTDEKLYIGLANESVSQLVKKFSDISGHLKLHSPVKIEFEVKHMFFDTLIKSVNAVDPVIVQRLLPQAHDFLKPTAGFLQYKHHMHTVISQLDPDDQLTALRKIVMCPAQSPPILINGSFGTGKTRVLAVAAYYITEMARDLEPARVLICAHHQVSADNFVEMYFGEMVTSSKYSWQCRLIRLTSFFHHYHSEKFSKFYMKFDQLRVEVQSLTRCNKLVICTTNHTALSLHRLFRRGFFTHILLDEGAQSREPEAIAPLSLASTSTKIVIAGDSCQVS